MKKSISEKILDAIGKWLFGLYEKQRGAVHITFWAIVFFTLGWACSSYEAGELSSGTGLVIMAPIFFLFALYCRVFHNLGIEVKIREIK